MRRQHYLICLLFIIAAQIIALGHPFLTLPTNTARPPNVLLR